MNKRGPIPGAVVGQYFGIFNGVPKDHYKAIVDAAPFDRCNLLIIAFVHTVLKDGKYIAQFKNERDNKFTCTSGDDDEHRVNIIVDRARDEIASENSNLFGLEQQ
jgi:hypothetical protein